jgi:hypothetical protein
LEESFHRLVLRETAELPLKYYIFGIGVAEIRATKLEQHIYTHIPETPIGEESFVMPILN